MARGKKGEGPSKMQLVRDAMAALGPSAKPVAIQKQIKEAANVDLSTQMISTYKSMAKKPKKGRKPGNPVGRPPKAAAAPSGGGTSTEDVAMLRKLVSRLGVGHVHQLVDVLA